jgi:hypothetical protein
MPIRKIPKNYRNVTGIAAHAKAGGAAQFESTLERDFISLLEFSPEVSAFDVQPIVLEWFDSKGKSHTYTPDTLVSFRKKDGLVPTPWLCEVKYRDELREKWLELRPKFKAAVRFAKAQGWRFRIVTEEEIRTPYLANVRFLMRYRLPYPDANLMQIAVDRLAEMRETDAEGLIKAIYHDEWNQAMMLSVIWYLVATFQIGADLHQPLTMKSRIWMP